MGGEETPLLLKKAMRSWASQELAGPRPFEASRAASPGSEEHWRLGTGPLWSCALAASPTPDAARPAAEAFYFVL